MHIELFIPENNYVFGSPQRERERQENGRKNVNETSNEKMTQ
jgi:hypothetical protein